MRKTIKFSTKNSVIVFILLLMSITLVPVRAEAGIPETLSTKRFSVVQMNADGSFNALSEHDDFNSAKSTMNSNPNRDVMVKDNASRSASKLVAMKGGSSQSYPFREGLVATTGKEAGLLAYIYRLESMSGDRTYIAAHYQMKYIETLQTAKGIIAKVEISGFIGYIDIQKLDLIPYLVLEKGLSWTLGGNDDYNKVAQTPIDVKMNADKYIVKHNATYKVNEMDYTYYLGWSKRSDQTIFSIGVAPDWLKPGTYYSTDGMEFYTDIRQTNRVKDNKGKPGRHVNYFQFLPLRSNSSITGAEFDQYLVAQGYTDSVYAGLGQVFVDNGKKYGVNPLLVYAMASLESAYGTSKYAKDRYNIFGWGAVDSNPDNANAFDGINHVVEKQMAHNLRGYSSINDWRFFGYSIGNKGSGFNTMYASDPYWGMKIGAISYRIDRAYGLRDYEAYNLGQMNDNTAINVRSSASNNAGVLYQTKAGRKDQFITLNKSVGEFYETYSSYPIKNGVIVPYVNDKQDVAIDLNKNLAYVHGSVVTRIDKILNKDNIVKPEPPKPVTLLKYRVDTKGLGLNVRAQATTGSAIIGSIADTSIIFGSPASNGWVQVTHQGKVGFVSADFVFEVKGDGYLLGDGNQDGVVDMQDFYKVGFHILGKEIIAKDKISLYDVNKDGIIDMQDYYAVSFHILGSKPITGKQ